MEKVPSTAEMYFLFSAESFVIRCPHVQYIIPVLQCLRHTLQCHFGSTLIISHSSVFPAAMSATFDSSLKGLNDWCCSRSFWIASFCGWLSILWIKSWMLMLWERFHRRIGNTRDVEINVLVVHCKVELIRINQRFLRWQSSCTLCNLSSLSGCPDLSWFFKTRFSSSLSGCPDLSEELSSSCNLPTISWVTGCPRSIFNGFRELGWLGRTRLTCSSKWLLNEFPNWSMFNCRTLIFSFTPIEIVFQRDLRWWSRRQVLLFIQFLSISQSFSSYNAMGWKCSLKNNCVRSCLIEH